MSLGRRANTSPMPPRHATASMARLRMPVGARCEQARSRRSISFAVRRSASSRRDLLTSPRFDQPSKVGRSPGGPTVNQGQVRDGWPSRGGRQLREGARPPSRAVTKPQQRLAIRAGWCPGRRYSTDARPQARQRGQRAITWGRGYVFAWKVTCAPQPSQASGQ
jgi:hypothetical protein